MRELPFRREEIRRILVRLPNWLGDAVMAAPALERLARAFPDARIFVAAPGGLGLLYEGAPWFGGRVVEDRKGCHRGILGRVRLARELQTLGADLAVLFPNSLDAALVAWGARIPWRFGYATDGRGPWLRPALPRPPGWHQRHQVQYYLDLVQPLAPEGPAVPQLHLREQEREQVARARERLGLPADAILVGMHPGAAYGQAKCWSWEGYARVARALARMPGVRVVLFGSETEASLAQALQEQAGEGVFSLAGRTSLLGLMGWLASCRVLVCNDSGPMHLAAALGTPVVALFGPTNPLRTGPLGEGHRVLRRPVACAPCRYRVCPTDHQCMGGIPEEWVIRAVEEILHGWPRRRGRGAVFLDRDGTVNREVGYLSDPRRLELLPGAAEAVARLNRVGIPVILISNQSGVGRGYFSRDVVEAIHRRLEALLAQAGAHLDGIYWCPHRPDAGCRCRKPESGMLEAAALRWGILLEESYVVGDRLGDVETARRVGARGILVQTGYGGEEWLRWQREGGPEPAYVAQNLAGAVDWILKEEGLVAEPGPAPTDLDHQDQFPGGYCPRDACAPGNPGPVARGPGGLGGETGVGGPAPGTSLH